MKECKNCKWLIFEFDNYRCRKIRDSFNNILTDIKIKDLTFYCKFWENK